MNFLPIYDFGKGTRLDVTDDGLRLTGKAAFTENDLDAQLAMLGGDKFAQSLRMSLPVMMEQGAASIIDGTIAISAENLSELYSDDYGLKSWLPPWCPFTLSVESRGSIGSPDLTYEHSFFHGVAQVHCIRFGAYLKHGSKFYAIPLSLYTLIRKLDEFNALDSGSKSKGKSLRVLSEIKALTEGTQVELDSYLTRENVVIPDKVGIGLDFDASGRLSMFPQFQSVSEDKLKKSFLRFTDVQDVYDLDTTDGGRIRVVLSEEIKHAASRMRQISHVGGNQKEQIIADPRSVFEGIENQDCLDLSQFGPRVKGIGPYVFQPKPYIRPVSGKFLDLETDSLFSKAPDGTKKYKLGIQAEDAEGNLVDVPFDSREHLKSIMNAVTDALSSGVGNVKVLDKDGIERLLPVTDELRDGLASIENSAIASKNPVDNGAATDGKEPKSRQDLRYVLIYENEDSLDYSEASDVLDDFVQPSFHRPSSLKTDIDGKEFALKPYQESGIAWLQDCLASVMSTRRVSARRGVLLADDMGLGKTLQILAFLSWTIEELLKDQLGKDRGPYKPILVVAPVILLENWQQEIVKFFQNDGAIFLPFDVVYGDRLKAYKNATASGKEYQIGSALLDLDKLRKNRLVITNYDTVKNYQHSFASIEWSIVVVDEAQEIKEPKTAVTWALKSLNALFKVAMTGTPVENRLLDLWNISDFYQPGLLGSAKEFTKEFETGIETMTEQQRHERSDDLRKRLKFNRAGAYVVRRTKMEELQGLPKKKEHILETKLSPEQINLHHTIVQELKGQAVAASGQHLKAVQRLSRLYQHSALETETRTEQTGAYYCSASPKLSAVMELLEEIRSSREKVLIFALFKKMQLILQRAVEDRFRFKPDIVNGSISTSMTDGSSMRRTIINRFENKDGFNVLILSPDVAGVGLTITGANHVIHYGRWWNPAKEAQATDRVYRLGQTKDVHVYYPISVAEDFTSFDVRLHELLQRKQELARDFLMPSGSLEVSNKEILEQIADLKENSGSTACVTTGFVKRLEDLDPERFAAFCAAYYVSQGFHVLLAPTFSNGGIDAIAVKQEQVILLSCSFDLSTEVNGGLSVESLKRSCDLYKKQFLPPAFSSSKIELSFLTNRVLDRGVVDSAKRGQIRTVDREELKKFLERKKVSMASLNSLIDARLNNIDQIKESLIALLSLS